MKIARRFCLTVGLVWFDWVVCYGISTPVGYLMSHTHTFHLVDEVFREIMNWTISIFSFVNLLLFLNVLQIIPRRFAAMYGWFILQTALEILYKCVLGSIIDYFFKKEKYICQMHRYIFHYLFDVFRFGMS